MKKISLFLIIISFFYTNYSFSEEKIIFSINNKSYTTIDIENKINYLLLVNKMEKNKENFDKIKSKAKENLIEEILISEFIKERNISISEKDINITYNNMTKFLTGDNNEIFLKMINKYDLTLEYIKNEIVREISKEIIKQILTEEIDVDSTFLENINYENYIKYKINNLILYRNNISEKNYNLQKKEILKIFKENNFNNSINIIISKEFNINYYQQKLINLDSINNELKKLIKNAKMNIPLIYEDKESLYIIEKIEILEPNIELIYSFIQITSNNKDDLTKYINNIDICKKENISKLKEKKNINTKYFENISRKKLNQDIFNKLNNEYNYILIKTTNLNTLIFICDKTYNDNELKEYAVNQKYMNEINFKYKKLLKKLKNTYNYTNH